MLSIHAAGSFVKPNLSYDLYEPFGAQTGGAQRSQAKALVFGLSAEELSVKW